MQDSLPITTELPVSHLPDHATLGMRRARVGARMSNFGIKEGQRRSLISAGSLRSPVQVTRWITTESTVIVKIMNNTNYMLAMMGEQQARHLMKMAHSRFLMDINEPLLLEMPSCQTPTYVSSHVRLWAAYAGGGGGMRPLVDLANTTAAFTSQLLPCS
jgi:hypothetical protein